MPSLSWYVDLSDPALTSAVAALRGRLHAAGWPDTRAQADAVMVWADRPLPERVMRRLLDGSVPVLLGGPTLDRADVEGRLAEAAGLMPGTPTRVHDIRVRTGSPGAPGGARSPLGAPAGDRHLGGHLHLLDRVLPVDKTTDDVEVLLTANLGLTEQPVACWRPSTGILAWTPGSTIEAVSAAAMPRLLVLALRHALAVPAAPTVGVGLLGFGAIGAQHLAGVAAVDGLTVAAVCDWSAPRTAAARAHAPDARTYADPEALLADPDVDLVVVSTPPNTHADWALQALGAGRHVVVEKPFALEPADADRMLAAAAERDLLAVPYQNRRYDPDYLAVRRAVAGGRIGEVFHLESFVGGYAHPCNLWHSDEGVSGGAVYDWGAHVLDQVLDLIPTEVTLVTAAEHKRVWADVTNADHSRVTVRFADGAEAEFVHSDVAAALKPRWYVLGTRGALVGSWRTERVIGRSDVGTLTEDVLAPADSPPVLDLFAPDGSVTRLATPPAPPAAFYAEVADRLRLGLPMSVTGAQARRVIAVLAAARASAAAGGIAVQPC